MSVNRDAPIGMFDSGAGGVSVLRDAVRLLPRERFLYFGDNGNAPYGTKPREVVLALADSAVSGLIERGVKAVVIACNTATADAAKELRARYTIPIIGMEPALKPASLMRRSGIVLVLATPGTLRSQKYAALSAKYGENAFSLPCPGLMEFVERGDRGSAELRQFLSGLFTPFCDQTIDAVVLGCTHYVFLKALIRDMLPAETAVIDGNEGTVRQLKRMLEERDLLSGRRENGGVSISTSGDEHALQLLWELYRNG